MYRAYKPHARAVVPPVRPASGECRCLRSDRTSLSTRLQLSLVASAAGVVLAVGVLAVLLTGVTRDSALQTADVALQQQMRENTVTRVREVAAALERRLESAAESIAMATALQMRLLLSTTNPWGSQHLYTELPLRVDPAGAAFPEYLFRDGHATHATCASSPHAAPCPSDFGDLGPPRGRLPGAAGSARHSSVYMLEQLESGVEQGVHSAAEWDAALARWPEAPTLIRNTALLDADWDEFYTRGPASAILSYGSLLFQPTGSRAALSVHRTFPGVARSTAGAEGPYVPRERPWFREAPEDGVSLTAYNETFSGELVVNLSSRKTVDLVHSDSLRPHGRLTAVAACVMRLADIQRIVRAGVAAASSSSSSSLSSSSSSSSLSSTADGAGAGLLAVAHAETGQVLVFGDRGNDELYRDGAFVELQDIEPGHPREVGDDLLEFTRADGQSWYVGQVPIMDGLLRVLLYVRRADTSATFDALESNVASTTSAALAVSVAGLIATLGAAVAVAAMLTRRIARPMAAITAVTRDVTSEAARGHGFAGYSALIDRLRHVPDGDEIGDLATGVRRLINKLRHMKRSDRARPKFPLNPLRLGGAAKDAGWAPRDSEQRARSSSAATVGKYSDRASAPSRDDEATSETADRDCVSESFLRSTTPSAALPAAHADSSGAVLVVDSSLAAALAAPHGPDAREAATRSRQVHADAMAHAAIAVAAADSGGSRGERERARRSGDVAPRPHAIAATRSSRSLLEVQNPMASLEPPIELEPAHSSRRYSVTFCVLWPFLATLVTGVAASMTASLSVLGHQAGQWTDEALAAMVDQEAATMREVAHAKGDFIGAYFEQVSLDVAQVARFSTSLEDGVLQLEGVAQGRPGRFLPSYSLDPTDSQFSHDVSPWLGASGYFYFEARDCDEAGTCATYNDMPTTRRTSLLDLKLRSLYHARHNLDFIQTGDAATTQTRYYSYRHKQHGQPYKCYVEATEPPDCTACDELPELPAYNPHCRRWYQTAVAAGDPTRVWFEMPRVSSGGSVVVTGVTPIKANGTAEGALHGVLNFNVLVQEMSDAVNGLRIRDTGYAFVIARSAAGSGGGSPVVILHPRLEELRASCPDPPTLDCVEDSFADEDERRAFQRDVLDAVARGNAVPESYWKRGSRHMLATAEVSTGTVSYALLVTVPEAEILAPLRDVADVIDSSIASDIVIFSVVVAVAVAAIYVLLRRATSAIVEPISGLLRLTERLLAEDLSHTVVATGTTSLEMKHLLEAFGGVIVALRFGSAAYWRGDTNRAMTTFQDAVREFRGHGSAAGIGIALNNLGCVELKAGQVALAQEHLQAAVDIAHAQLAAVLRAPTAAGEAGTAARAPAAEDGPGSAATSEVEKGAAVAATAATPEEVRARHVVADRTSNLAACLLTRGNVEGGLCAVQEALQMDAALGSVLGAYKKRLTLGQAYAQGRDLGLALGEYREVLRFASDPASAHVADPLELQVLAQAALVHMSRLQRGTGDPAAIASMLDALTRTVHCDMATVRAGLQDLAEMADEQRLPRLARDVDAAISRLFPAAPKDVVFLFDCSGSMAGARGRRAATLLLDLFENHCGESDRVMLVSFNDAARVVRPLRVRGAAKDLREALEPLISEQIGATAFRDALQLALAEADDAEARGDDSDGSAAVARWVVAVTDGDDNRSSVSQEAILAQLRHPGSPVRGLCVMRLGDDDEGEATGVPDASELQALVQATPLGVFVRDGGGADTSVQAVARQFTAGRERDHVPAEVFLEEFA